MYTGNTYLDWVSGYLSPVYPCVYREHKILILLIFGKRGLSLCIQGTRTMYIVDKLVNRFIPVYTGNTTAWIEENKDPAVYPCVYREHDREIVQRELAERFIPVYTGNTLPAPDVIESLDGLSLCIQGTLPSPSPSPKMWRFIPVYTWNTFFRRKESVKNPVYPCVYREHDSEYTQRNFAPGLSLCIQGTPVHLSLRHQQWRFIPVYTGNTNAYRCLIT